MYDEIVVGVLLVRAMSSSGLLYDDDDDEIKIL